MEKVILGMFLSICLPFTTAFTGAPSNPNGDCEDGCKLSHQTTGTTAMVVTVVWGAGSQAGTCVPHQQAPTHCDIIANCEFGAYEVKVTGTGTLKWRLDDGTFGKPEKIEGDVSRRYGNAANPQEEMCGQGLVTVTFPDDLAGGGAHCTSCN